MTPGCEAPVIRKSNRGRPPKYCDGCKTGYAADLRTKNGMSHQSLPQPHMLAEEHRKQRAEELSRELDQLPLDEMTEEHWLWLMDDSATRFEFIGFDRGKVIRTGSTITRPALRKPVMDLENEPARGPKTIGTNDRMPGGTDEYYERKRRLGLITDERHTK